MDYGSSQLKGVLLFDPLCGVLGEGVAWELFWMLRTPETPMGSNNKENILLEEQRDAEDAEPKVRSSSNTCISCSCTFLSSERQVRPPHWIRWTGPCNPELESDFELLVLIPGSSRETRTQSCASIRVTWTLFEYTVFESMICGRTQESVLLTDTQDVHNVCLESTLESSSCKNHEWRKIFPQTFAVPSSLHDLLCKGYLLIKWWLTVIKYIFF